jgi:hypothetical protein
MPLPPFPGNPSGERLLLFYRFLYFRFFTNSDKSKLGATPGRRARGPPWGSPSRRRELLFSPSQGCGSSSVFGFAGGGFFVSGDRVRNLGDVVALLR